MTASAYKRKAKRINRRARRAARRIWQAKNAKP